MEDKLLFEKVTLENGITIYSKQWNVPYVVLNMFCPVGHIHNTGKFLPGSAHLLEHLVCDSSKRFPEKKSFDLSIMLEGAYFSAHTKHTMTDYCLYSPREGFDEILQQFFEHFSEPLITDEAIRNEIGVIEAEAAGMSRWYPANSKVNHYCIDGWRKQIICPLEQCVGTRESLEKVNSKALRELHRAYFDPRMHIFVGGSHDLDRICKLFSTLPITPHKLESKFGRWAWNKRMYHEFPCIEEKMYYYHWGGFFERDVKIETAIEFLNILFCNPVQGVLCDWLRKELHSAYEIGFNLAWTDTERTSEWEIYAPLCSRDTAEFLRAHMHEKIQDALQDTSLIKREVTRRRKKQVFALNTIEKMLQTAARDVHALGKIVTEQESIELLEAVANPSYLQMVYEQYMSPEVSGEFLATPDTV